MCSTNFSVKFGIIMQQHFHHKLHYFFSFWGHTVAPLCHNQPHDHQKFTTTMNNFTSELQEEEEEKEKPKNIQITSVSSRHWILLVVVVIITGNSWIDDTYRSQSPPPLTFHLLNWNRKKNHTHFEGKEFEFRNPSN